MICLQVWLQWDAKCPISASWGARESGSGCWALPWRNSPKFIALVMVVRFMF